MSVLLEGFKPSLANTFESVLTASVIIYPLNISVVNHTASEQTVELRLVKSGESNHEKWSIGHCKLSAKGDKESTANITSIIAPVGSILMVISTSIDVSILVNGLQ